MKDLIPTPTSRGALISVLTLLFCSACSCPVPEETAQTAVEVHGQLSVSGNRIVDQTGEPVSLAGPSLFFGNQGWKERAQFYSDTYYNAAVVETVQRDWNAAIIRIAMGVESPGGYLFDPEGRMEKIVTVADAAIEQGMYFIVDWHSFHAQDYPDDAVAFFRLIAEKYGDTPNLIYEIYNEPRPETDWATMIKPYAEKVIAAIREIDPDNLIIVGTQTWSTGVDKAADDPITGYENIAYTLHFYAGTHTQKTRDKAAYAMDKGIALMVTEWGTVDANGDGTVYVEATETWMDFLRENDLSHCNWSLHSKTEGASILDYNAGPDGDWDEGDYSPSGKLVTGIIKDWHERDYAGADD